MNAEVFRALLALDSYNRGYNQGIDGLPSNVGSQLGSATVTNVAGDPADQSIGFYAIAYSWNDETVISYRGTDDYDGEAWPPASGSDALYGWPLGLGEFGAAQGWAVEHNRSY